MDHGGGLRALAIVLWVLVLALIPSTASAHSVGNYWYGEWANQDRGTTAQYYEFTEQVPGDTANSSFANRVANGAQQWNAIDISNPDMHFVKNGVVANYNPYTQPCPPSTNFRNGIHYRPTQDGTGAQTGVCYVPTAWGPQVRHFNMVFNSEVEPFWYVGTDPDNILNDQLEVAGVSAHEFGHVVGGWSEDLTTYGHYDSTLNAALCDVAETVRHTLCRVAHFGTGEYRTLEPHDTDVFVAAYS